jgi:hypothetical protein
MARSPAVWVVIDTTGQPVASFTVKHELCEWLWKYENPQSIVNLRGWKVVDGYRHWIDKEKSGPWPLDLLSLRGLGEQAEAQQKIRDLWPKSWE